MVGLWHRTSASQAHLSSAGHRLSARYEVRDARSAMRRRMRVLNTSSPKRRTTGPTPSDSNHAVSDLRSPASQHRRSSPAVHRCGSHLRFGWLSDHRPGSRHPGQISVGLRGGSPTSMNTDGSPRHCIDSGGCVIVSTSPGRTPNPRAVEQSQHENAGRYPARHRLAQ